jgi:RecB family endonuclease NucS
MTSERNSEMSVAAVSVAHVSRHSEAQIVTALAGSLGLLEPGLELVETQYRMANPRGAGGRCDILARDRHRDYVLIEVKENDPTARTALQEVTK